MRPKIRKPFLCISCIVTFIIQLVIIFNSYSEIGWDCDIIIQNALNLSTGKEFNHYYFATYPNNTFLLLFFEMIIRILNFLHIENIWLCFDLINIILIDISIFITYLVAKEIFGVENSWIIFLFAIPLIALTPYIIVPYSDTLSMLFPILLFFLFLKRKKTPKKSKYILDAFMGVVFTLGILIKPSCVIIGIAIILIEFLYSKPPKDKIYTLIKRLYISILCFLIAIFITMISFELIKNSMLGISKEEYEKYEFPLTHFFMMGLRSKKIHGKYSYGLYDGKDVSMTASFIGKKEKTTYTLGEIKQRLSNMGILGYLKFLYNKTNWILADGTFYFGWEGNFYTKKCEVNTNFAKKLQNYFDTSQYEFTSYTINFFQGIWLVHQLFLILPIVNLKNEYKDRNIMLIRMAILGLVLFIALWEGRSRYLINYLPFFSLLATHGLIVINEKLKNHHVLH